MVDAGLTGGEILEKAYNHLCEKHKAQTITLSNVAEAEIADDSDWHRTKKGYMSYKEVGAFNFNSFGWIIGLGNKCGDYPAERFDKDILALKYEPNGKDQKQVDSDIISMIRRSEYFENSIMLSMSDGRLLGGPNFGKHVKELLGNKFKEYIAQQPEYDTSGILVSTMSYICEKSMTFKEEFADVLVDTIEKILKDIR